jgi:hypothetical protein
VLNGLLFLSLATVDTTEDAVRSANKNLHALLQSEIDCPGCIAFRAAELVIIEE